MSRRNGTIIAAVGSLALIYAVVMTGFPLLFSERDACADLFKLKHNNGNVTLVSTNEFRLGDPICIAINKQTFEQDSGTAGTPALGPKEELKATAPTYKKITLFINGIRTHSQAQIDFNNKSINRDGLLYVKMPLDIRKSADSGGVTKREPGTGDSNADEADLVWSEIFSANGNLFRRPVYIGVSDEEQPTKPRIVAQNPSLVIISDPLLLCIGAAGLLLIAAGVVVGNWKTGLLRDRPPTTGDPNPPFSLGRAQTGIWILVIVSGFIFLWLVTGAYNDILNADSVTLLGIASATGLLARLASPNQEAAQVAGDQGVPGAAAAPQSVSQGFFNDILSDQNSISLLRIQMLAWTLIMTAIFIWSVARHFQFPHFGNELLVLSGLVNGSYLGSKFPLR